MKNHLKYPESDKNEQLISHLLSFCRWDEVWMDYLAEYTKSFKAIDLNT